MKQAAFERLHQARWLEFAAQLDALERGKASAQQADAFPAAYRQLCQHLAIAESARHSSQLVEQLQRAGPAWPQQFYRHRSPLLGRMLGFITGGFARAVRLNGATCWRPACYGSLLGMAALVYAFPDLVCVLPADRSRRWSRCTTRCQSPGPFCRARSR